jgi:uncharacterized protein DUF222
MTATAHEPRSGRDATLLDAVREQTRLAREAEIRRLELIVEWCAVHEVDEATVVEHGHDTGLALAGPGAPCVSEFAVIELAAALGMTADACRRHVGQVLEVRHRLPQVWARVSGGALPWWRAGRIADHTQALPAAGAAHVDRHLAPVAHKVGMTLTERLCAEALDTFDPERADERRRAAAEARHVTVRRDQAGRHGTVDVSGSVDTGDGLDLEAAVAQAAAELKAGGSTDPLDVRRAMALGVIARHYLGESLKAGRDGSGPLVKPRQVSIHVHLRDQATGRCETTRTPVSVDQVKGWCTNPDTQIVIRQVIDLNEHVRVDQYEVPDRLADQVTERDGTCVHPWCTRAATNCDDDHCVPYQAGGPTSSDNIAPLCRRHHRTKTHDRWRYRFLRPGAYLWRSPTGHWYHRDGTGTTDLGRLTPN